MLDPTQAAEAQTAINAGYDFLGLSATGNSGQGRARNLGHAVELLNAPLIRFGGVGIEVVFLFVKDWLKFVHCFPSGAYLDLILAVDQHHAKTRLSIMRA